jgi:HlyD family secretion protein
VQLVLDVDEKNLRLIALGQKAQVSADAFAQERFVATVAYINPGVNAQTGAVQVKFDVDHAPAYLRQDMTVSIDIEVARRPQALVLSAAAVHALDSTAPWCWVYAQGQARRTPITVGSRSAGLVEVLSGLAEGDRVILGAGTIRDDQRVRARSAAP